MFQKVEFKFFLCKHINVRIYKDVSKYFAMVTQNGIDNCLKVSKERQNRRAPAGLALRGKRRPVAVRHHPISCTGERSAAEGL